MTIPEIISSIVRRGTPTRSGGKTKDLRDAMVAVLRSNEPLALVAVIDARPEELEDTRADARSIVEQCESETTSVPVCIGLAIHEIEAWMLADPQSHRAAFGRVHELPAQPEELSDPKALWQTYAGQTPRRGDADLHADDQRRAALEAMRIEIVATSCPRGFAPFAEQLQRSLRGILIDA